MWAQSERIKKNCQKLPKKKQQQHETFLFASTQTATVTLTSYQCKKQKSEVIMRTLHPDVKITLDNNLKKKTEPVLFNYKTKADVDVIDQMARKSSLSAARRRWPIHLFYND